VTTTAATEITDIVNVLRVLSLPNVVVNADALTTCLYYPLVADA
jgi:hypothetical protein